MKMSFFLDLLPPLLPIYKIYMLVFHLLGLQINIVDVLFFKGGSIYIYISTWNYYEQGKEKDIG